VFQTNRPAPHIEKRADFHWGSLQHFCSAIKPDNYGLTSGLLVIAAIAVGLAESPSLNKVIQWIIYSSTLMLLNIYVLFEDIVFMHIFTHHQSKLS
jgi:hypothetical protein